ncbi:hypothetical protein EMCRGX_G013802 [Ephydatia muelleri]
MTWKLSAPGGRVGRGGEFTFKGCSNPGSDSCTAGWRLREFPLFWTYIGSKVVNTSDIIVTEESHGDMLTVTMAFSSPSPAQLLPPLSLLPPHPHTQGHHHHHLTCTQNTTLFTDWCTFIVN